MGKEIRIYNTTGPKRKVRIRKWRNKKITLWEWVKVYFQFIK